LVAYPLQVLTVCPYDTRQKHHYKNGRKNVMPCAYIFHPRKIQLQI
jgi:hypothetical protein